MHFDPRPPADFVYNDNNYYGAASDVATISIALRPLCMCGMLVLYTISNLQSPDTGSSTSGVYNTVVHMAYFTYETYS